MTKRPIFLAACFLLGVSQGTSGQELPASAKSLKKSYEQAIERATTPITTKYLAELGRLKQQAEKAKDVDAVAALDAEIERASVTSTEALNDAEAMKMKLTQKPWIGTSGGLNKWTLVFDASGKISMKKPDGLAGFGGWSWRVTDNNEIQIASGSDFQTVVVSKRIDQITFAGIWGTIIKQR